MKQLFCINDMCRILRIQSKRLPVQVAEDIEQHVVEAHHDPGGRYLGKPRADHGHYISKISTWISKIIGTYFLDVG